MRSTLIALTFAALCACGSPPASCDSSFCADGGSAGGSSGMTGGGSASAGGSTAGGSASAGGSSAGGAAVAGGSTAGGSTAGGSAAGGSVAGGSATAGGSTAGGSATAGGSTAGGTASDAGFPIGPDGGLVCSASPFTVIFTSQHDAGGILTDLDARDGGLRVQLSATDQFSFLEVLLTNSGIDAGVRTFTGAALIGRAETAAASNGTLAMAWTPANSAITTRFFPLVGQATENTAFLVDDFDSLDLAWHPRREEFAVFHVRRNPASSPTTIAMRRFSTDGGLLGESDPIVRGFVTLNRNLVAPTQLGYLVGTSGALTHVPGDGGTATTGLTVPGLVRAVATTDDDAALVYRASDGGTLWFNRAQHDGTAAGVGPTVVDPGGVSLYSALTFDGFKWRVAFIHQPTQHAWLATLSRSGTLEALEPVTCDSSFAIAIAPNGLGKVAIGVAGENGSRVVTTP